MEKNPKSVLDQLIRDGNFVKDGGLKSNQQQTVVGVKKRKMDNSQ